MNSFPKHRAIGTLLGLALGDAYGRTLEFVSGEAVRTNRVSIDPNVFMWTDDTHMSIYLAQALLNCNHYSEDHFAEKLGEQFLFWLEDPLTPSTAPGNTCLAGMRNYAAI